MAVRESDKPAGRAEGAPEAGRRSKVRNERTCVGCGASAPKEHSRSSTARITALALGEGAEEVLVRFVVAPDGALAVDGADGGFGRGAHVHPHADCLEKAAHKGFARSAKRAVSLDGAPVTRAALAGAIAEAFDRRIEGLLTAARRAKKVAVGGDATSIALRMGRAALVVVASDAAAAAKLGEVQYAVAAGKAVSWGDKDRLARCVRPSRAGAGEDAGEIRGVGVVGVEDVRLGAALRESVFVLDAVRPLTEVPRARGKSSAKVSETVVEVEGRGDDAAPPASSSEVGGGTDGGPPGGVERGA